MEKIPVVDLQDFTTTDSARRGAFVRTLGGALERFGFVSVKGHGIDDALLDEAYAVAARVFALPEASKRACETPENGRQRGYTPFQMERAKDHATPDLKEFWHVGRTVPDEHPLARAGLLSPNRYPAEVPEFETIMRRLYAALEGFALHLLDAVGEHLGRPPELFRDLARDGNSVLRIIHYPDTGFVPVGAVRAAAHEDINLMTVLPASTRPGLEILTHEGEWMPVETPPGVMVCDTGDMMALLTGNQLPATTHRVVNPEGGGDGGRFSMPFFLHPHPDAMLTPLRGDATPRRAHDFLRQRLVENGLV